MNFIENLDRLAKMARLIRSERTGTPEEFAKKCNFSSMDSFYYQMDILRQLAGKADAKIIYEQDIKTYCFSPRGKFSNFEFIKTIESDL